MNKVKVKFVLIYGVGWCQLKYGKSYELPFVPFEGLHVSHETDDYGVSFDLVNSRNQNWIPYYDLADHELTIEVHHNWQWGTMDYDGIIQKIQSLNGLHWESSMKQSEIDEFLKHYSHPDSKGGDHE